MTGVHVKKRGEGALRDRHTWKKATWTENGADAATDKSTRCHHRREEARTDSPVESSVHTLILNF